MITKLHVLTSQFYVTPKYELELEYISK